MTRISQLKIMLRETFCAGGRIELALVDLANYQSEKPIASCFESVPGPGTGRGDANVI